MTPSHIWELCFVSPTPCARQGSEANVTRVCRMEQSVSRQYCNGPIAFWCQHTPTRPHKLSRASLKKAEDCSAPLNDLFLRCRTACTRLVPLVSMFRFLPSHCGLRHRAAASTSSSGLHGTLSTAASHGHHTPLDLFCFCYDKNQ